MTWPTWLGYPLQGGIWNLMNDTETTPSRKALLNHLYQAQQQVSTLRYETAQRYPGAERDHASAQRRARVTAQRHIALAIELTSSMDESGWSPLEHRYTGFVR